MRLISTWNQIRIKRHPNLKSEFESSTTIRFELANRLSLLESALAGIILTASSGLATPALVVYSFVGSVGANMHL